MIINCTISPINGWDLDSNRSTNKKLMSTFNHLMISVEDNIRMKRYRKLCRNSKKVKQLIESNLFKLKEEEPHYGWEEMEDLMIALQKQICRRSYS